MIKQCDNCKKEMLKCIKCKDAGAFDEGGENALVHDGDCVYEACQFCEQEHKRKFAAAMQEAAEQQLTDALTFGQGFVKQTGFPPKTKHIRWDEIIRTKDVT